LFASLFFCRFYQPSLPHLVGGFAEELCSVRYRNVVRCFAVCSAIGCKAAMTWLVLSGGPLETSVALSQLSGNPHTSRVDADSLLSHYLQRYHGSWPSEIIRGEPELLSRDSAPTDYGCPDLALLHIRFENALLRCDCACRFIPHST
jgi:hypothetical protein